MKINPYLEMNAPFGFTIYTLTRSPHHSPIINHPTKKILQYDDGVPRKPSHAVHSTTYHLILLPVLISLRFFISVQKTQKPQRSNEKTTTRSKWRVAFDWPPPPLRGVETAARYFGTDGGQIRPNLHLASGSSQNAGCEQLGNGQRVLYRQRQSVRYPSQIHGL